MTKPEKKPNNMTRCRSEQEKLALEHQAGKLFLRLYERTFAVPMRNIRHNEPAKPDISSSQAKHQLDIEIAHLYGSEKEAMAILGRDLSEQTRAELKRLAQEPVQQRLRYSLARILENKAHKTYQSERVWLVIRNANPHWGKRALKKALHHITQPKHTPFEQIWLICDMNGNSGLLRIA